MAEDSIAKIDAAMVSVDEGFSDSKIRDEKLRDLIKADIRASEVFLKEMHRRFDESDRKHQEKMQLLREILAPSAQRARRRRFRRKR
jgi:hypothetical protein